MGGRQPWLKGAGEDDAERSEEGERVVTTKDIRVERKIVPAYNFEVANAHTFFIGEERVLAHNHVPAPRNLPGFPTAQPATRKTPVQGGGGLRKRWKLPNGEICEWNSQHGEVELYDKRGKHKGAYNPVTGQQKPGKGPIPTRRVSP
jgi:hypothetical protein